MPTAHHIVESSVSGFAAFAAEGDGREVRAIGLDHELARLQNAGSGTHVLTVFESGDASEGHDVSEIDDLFEARKIFPEAMEHSADLVAIFRKNGDRVFPCSTLVDDDIELKLRCKFQLLAEEICLAFFQSSEIGMVLETVVVKAGFANSGNRVITCELA